MRLLPAVVMLLVLCPALCAAIKTEVVEYQLGDDKATYRGYLCYDDALKDKRPGVLVCHEWWGCNEYAADRARQLAGLGYVAFAVDMYGKGNVTTDPKQAGAWAGSLMGDSKALRDRAGAGLEVLARSPRVDPGRLAAIGYCMGGTVALELARAGADLKAVVAFHASTITARDPADNRNIKGRVLICHGADDHFVPEGAILKFEQEMRDAGVDSTVISYSGAVHAFTNPAADKTGIPGVKYHAVADRRSWRHMRDLFDEAFGGA